jgi:hypothetical protein
MEQNSSYVQYEECIMWKRVQSQIDHVIANKEHYRTDNRDRIASYLHFILTKEQYNLLLKQIDKIKRLECDNNVVFEGRQYMGKYMVSYPNLIVIYI